MSAVDVVLEAPQREAYDVTVVKFAAETPSQLQPQLVQALDMQEGADGTGPGIYVSRAILRSYGGDLKWEPRARGSCFTIELEVAQA